VAGVVYAKSEIEAENCGRKYFTPLLNTSHVNRNSKRPHFQRQDLQTSKRWKFAENALRISLIFANGRKSHRLRISPWKKSHARIVLLQSI